MKENIDICSYILTINTYYRYAWENEKRKTHIGHDKNEPAFGTERTTLIILQN